MDFGFEPHPTNCKYGLEVFRDNTKKYFIDGSMKTEHFEAFHEGKDDSQNTRTD